MAQRRMLSKSISCSLQVDNLPIEAQLLFTWMIPHTDDEGRMTGHLKEIKGKVVPMKDWNLQKIDEYLKIMHNEGLIILWEKDGLPIIEFPGWNRHQRIRKDRYTPSELPSFLGVPDDDHRSNNGRPNVHHKPTRGNRSYSAIEDKYKEM